ncbi:hypothetical protein D3C84_881740 [compost metagenome]
MFLFPWLLRGHEFDAILVYAPSPITQVVPAIPLKWIKKARLALWVQDLWPESLAATGFVRNRFALALVGQLVRILYSCCDLLLVQSRAFVEPVARYASRDKIVYYPNSVLSEPSASPAVEIPEDLAKVLEQSFSRWRRCSRRPSSSRPTLRSEWCLLGAAAAWHGCWNSRKRISWTI